MTVPTKTQSGTKPRKFRDATTMAVALICTSFVPAEAFAADLLEVLDKTPATDAGKVAAGDATAVTAEGGPFETIRAAFDPKFKALFLGWKRLDPTQPGTIAIPSAKPVPAAQAHFTSAFGSRSDPFKGTRAMHSGIDLAGPVGTSIYAPVRFACRPEVTLVTLEPSG